MLRIYGAGSAGILQGAIGIGLSVRTLLGAAHSIFLTPNVNRQADSAERMAWTNDFQRHMVLIFVAVLPPVLLFSDMELAVLYAPPFIAAAPFVALFVAAEVITLLSGSYQALILADNRVRFHVAQNFSAQILVAAIAVVAIPRLGLTGAGLAVLSAPIVMFASTILYLRRQFGVRLSAEAAHMSLLALGMLLVCGVIGSLFPGMSATGSAAKAAACGIVWLVAIAADAPEDRARVRAVARERACAALRIARRGRLA